MVNKEVISKIIEYSIGKCRKPSYSIINISNHVKGAMNRFAESTRDELIEHGVIIDGHGHTIMEVDGKEDGVRIPVVNTVSKMLERECEDILNDYKKEYKELYFSNDDESLPLSEVHNRLDKYIGRISERVTEKGIEFNVDHNHPSLKYSMFTCLSEDDLNRCLTEVVVGNDKGVDGLKLYNVVKSITAESGNGTRMTIVNTNPMGKKTVNEEYFYEARDNLQKVWDDYAVEIQSDALHYAHSLVDSGKYSEADVKRDRNDLKTEIGKEINDYIKKRSLETFPKMIEPNIKEFKELGFELKFDWL